MVDYYCYSYPQKDFLIRSGLKMKGNDYHPKTKKKYWIFERSVLLNQLLEEWQKRKV